MTQALIKIVYGVVLDGTESIIFEEDASTLVHTTALAAGTYWGHADVGFDSDYPSLYLAIAAAMTTKSTASGNSYTYAISEATPTSSSSWADFGLQITSDAVISLDWDSSGTINNNGLMGFHPDDGIITGTTTVTSTRCHSLSWRSPQAPSLFGSTPMRTITPSTTYHERDDAYFFDRGTRNMRDVMIEYLPSAHCLTSRADLAEYASVGSLSHKDSFNSLERVWDWASQGNSFIYCYYNDSTTLDLQIDANSQWEVARLSDIKDMTDYSTWLRMMRVSGELYTAKWSSVCVDSTSTWQT